MAGKERARETRHDKTHFIVYGSRVYEFSIAAKIYAMTQTLFPHDPRIFQHFLSLAPRLTSIRLSIAGEQQIWIEEKRRTKKKQEGLRIFFGPTLKPKFWLERVLVCLGCECVLAKHQFFIIISRFSRISRNIGFFLASRDFLQPSKTFYVWTLNR